MAFFVYQHPDGFTYNMPFGYTCLRLAHGVLTVSQLSPELIISKACTYNDRMSDKAANTQTNIF